MPASEGFPGQPKTWFSEFISTQHVQFVFSEGCDHTSYVTTSLSTLSQTAKKFPLR